MRKEVGRCEAMKKAAIGKKPTMKVELGVSGDGRKVQPRSQTSITPRSSGRWIPCLVEGLSRGRREGPWQRIVKAKLSDDLDRLLEAEVSESDLD